MVKLFGATVIPVNEGETVTAAVPDRPPYEAVMVAEPVATAVTTPVAFTVATDVLLELYEAELVTV
jgi:hypothetical protein